MKNYIHVSVIAIITLAALLITSGCVEDGDTPTGGNPPDNTLTGIDLDIDTTAIGISFDSTRGVTQVSVRFIARDNDGAPISPDDIAVALLLNGAPIDVEGILDSNQAILASDFLMYLVLDASYSMVVHGAFAPMLSAAQELVATGEVMWTDRDGSFQWHLLWFNDSLHYATDWSPSDITKIPSPEGGTFTKLNAAVDYATAHVTSIVELDNFGAGPLDHRMVVVLSDGADNYSWYDNGPTAWTWTSLDASTEYASAGYPPTALEDALANLATANLGVVTHVLGLGEAVDDNALQSIADAGDGRYFKNPSADGVAGLFDSVTSEITTLQTYIAGLPLPSGDYTFTIEARSVASPNIAGSYSFDFHAGDSAAGIIN